MNIIEKSVTQIGKIEMGRNNYIGHNVVLIGPINIGNNNKIFPNTVIGTPAQHQEIKQDSVHSSNKNKLIEIGNNNIIREFTTIHKPMLKKTSIHNNCFIMAYNHLPHDFEVFDNVVMANNCQIGGHSKFLKNATIGLSSTIHQFSTIGSYAMVGMGSVISKDIPPFFKVAGNPAQIIGVNYIGMKRNGFKDNDIVSISEIINRLSEDKWDIKDVLSKNTIIKAYFQEFMSLRNNKRSIISKVSDELMWHDALPS